MNPEAIRAIALEFGVLPRIRPLGELDELGEVAAPTGRRLLVVSYTRLAAGRYGGGKARALLRACRSLRLVISRHERSPEWLTFVHEPRRVAALTARLNDPFTAGASVGEHVLFFSGELPERWSMTERSRFEAELDTAIDFLSALEPEADAEADAPASDESDRPLQLARQRRDELLRDEYWLSATEVHVQQGGKPDAQGANNTASRLRRARVLLGAWNGREYLHPAFQFHPQTGRLMDVEMKALLALLPKDKSGWRQSLWLFQRHAQLDGQRPADVFQKEPEAVIDAARSDFESSDERW